MVQRKVANKIGIKTHHHKSDTRLVNLRPTSSSSSSSSQIHEKMKKIMKKSRSMKRTDESSPPFRKKKQQQLQTDEPGTTPASPQKQSPNYMKSTSSFEARKEQSSKTLSPKSSRNSKTNDHSASSGVKGSRTSSLKMMRTLTKTTSFKPLRCSKKVILCEDVDAQRATCSSTLKESKFPNYLQLDPGGTDLDGTSVMKVCPYTYCSLNGHHHAPVPPLKCFLSARRRALKSQKGFKLGCLSPRQVKPNVMKFDVAEPVISAPEEEKREFFVGDQEEEKREFFVGDQDLECSDMVWEEGYCSDSALKLQEIDEDKTVKTSVETLYDEESVSSGAWSEEDGDSASESWCEQMKINQDYYGNFAASKASTTKAESEMNDKLDELQCLIVDENINNQKDERFCESKTVPDYAEEVKDETDKKHTTIIYNIIQFNISVFVNGQKTKHSETDKTCVASDEMKTEEEMEEGCMSDNEVSQMVADEELSSTEQLTETEKHGDPPEQECNDSSQLNSMDEEPAIISNVDQTHGTVEMTSETDNSFDTKNVNLRGCKKPREEIDDDSLEFNPRGPNFLPEIADPDAEKVDLRHQMMDERKNAEEWMVDFALQQAVTTLAPARKRKVALLVEAFEKVMPDPVPYNRHSSKAFTNSRPAQACS